MGLWEQEGVWSWGGGERGGREGVGGGWGEREGPNSLSELSSVFLPAIITSNLDETKSSSYRVDADNSFLLQICSPLPFPPSFHKHTSGPKHVQGYVVCPSEQRFLLLFTFLKKNQSKKVMVFFSSCNSVKFHSELLNYIDIAVMDIHVSEWPFMQQKGKV